MPDSRFGHSLSRLPARSRKATIGLRKEDLCTDGGSRHGVHFPRSNFKLFNRNASTWSYVIMMIAMPFVMLLVASPLSSSPLLPSTQGAHAEALSNVNAVDTRNSAEYERWLDLVTVPLATGQNVRVSTNPEIWRGCKFVVHWPSPNFVVVAFPDLAAPPRPGTPGGWISDRSLPIQYFVVPDPSVAVDGVAGPSIDNCNGASRYSASFISIALDSQDARDGSIVLGGGAVMSESTVFGSIINRSAFAVLKLDQVSNLTPGSMLRASLSARPLVARKQGSGPRPVDPTFHDPTGICQPVFHEPVRVPLRLFGSPLEENVLPRSALQDYPLVGPWSPSLRRGPLRAALDHVLDLTAKALRGALLPPTETGLPPTETGLPPPGTQPATLLSLPALSELVDAVLHVLGEGIPGDFVEAGAFRGGACVMMKATLDAVARLCPDCPEGRRAADAHIWCADAFEHQWPPVDEQAFVTDGGMDFSRFSTGQIPSTESVRQLFVRYGTYDPERVHLIDGPFSETLHTRVTARQFALVRLDGDLESSTIHSLDALYPRLSDGGVLILDDYNWFRSASCKYGTLRYRQAHGITDEMLHSTQSLIVDWVRGGVARAQARANIRALQSLREKVHTHARAVEQQQEHADFVTVNVTGYWNTGDLGFGIRGYSAPQTDPSTSSFELAANGCDSILAEVGNAALSAARATCIASLARDMDRRRHFAVSVYGPEEAKPNESFLVAPQGMSADEVAAAFCARGGRASDGAGSPGLTDGRNQCETTVRQRVLAARAAGWMTVPSDPLHLLAPSVASLFVSIHVYERTLAAAGVGNIPPHLAQHSDDITALWSHVRVGGSPRTVCVAGFRSGHEVLVYLSANPASRVVVLEPSPGGSPWAEAGRAALRTQFGGRVSWQSVPVDPLTGKVPPHRAADVSRVLSVQHDSQPNSAVEVDASGRTRLLGDGTTRRCDVLHLNLDDNGPLDTERQWWVGATSGPSGAAGVGPDFAADWQGSLLGAWTNQHPERRSGDREGHDVLPSRHGLLVVQNILVSSDSQGVAKKQGLVSELNKAQASGVLAAPIYERVHASGDSLLIMEHVAVGTPVAIGTK